MTATLPQRSVGSAAAPASQAVPKAKAGWASWMAVLFLLSLITPVVIDVGVLRLLPHRIALLIFFLPCCFLLFTKRAGRLIWPDLLFMLAAIWAALCLVVNHGLSSMIESMGIFTLEFFGSYLLARCAIRSAADFQRIVRCLLPMLMFMLPFAVIESFTGQPILLNMLPNTVGIIDFPYRLGLRRSQVLFSHPIHYGIFASLAFGLFWFVFRPGTRYFTFPIVFGSTFFSLSSGALICLVMQILLTTWEAVLKSVKQRWYIFSGGVFFVYLMTNIFTNSGFFILVSRYASFNSSSAFARILIWRYGTDNVAANPVFGLGLRDWARPAWLISSVDNFFLLLTMRYGLPFIMMYAVGLVLLMVMTLRVALNTDLDKRIRLGWLIVMIGGVIIGGGTVDYWSGMLAFVMFLFGAGVWLSNGGAAPPLDVDAEAQEPQARPRGMQYTRFPAKTDEAPPAAEPAPLQLTRARTPPLSPPRK